MKNIHICAFEPIEVQTRSSPQNDRLNLCFVDGGKLARNGRKRAILADGRGRLPIDNEYTALF